MTAKLDHAEQLLVCKLIENDPEYAQLMASATVGVR
jgi:hypothetical protein